MIYVLEAMLPLIISIGSALAFVLILRAIVLHRQKVQEDRRHAFSPLSPTLQWMNTAGSILIAVNGADFRYMGGIFYPGYEQDEAVVAGVKKMLWNYWGIDGRQRAMEEMTELVRTGMRAQYGKMMQLLEAKYAGYSEEELIAAAKQGNPKANEDSFLPKMLMAYRRYGENALLGWDVGRAAYIIQNCYLAGFVSMEEVLAIGVEAGKKAQAVFSAWEEMMESYLLGGQFWKHEDAGDPRSMTAKRWKVYEGLYNGKKPYRRVPYSAIAFDAPLSTEIITDKYGILPEYQPYYDPANRQS